MIVEYVVCECGRRGLVAWNDLQVDRVASDPASGAMLISCPVCRRDEELRKAVNEKPTPCRGDGTVTATSTGVWRFCTTHGRYEEVRRPAQQDRVAEARVKDSAPSLSGQGEVLSPEPVGGEADAGRCPKCAVWRHLTPCKWCGCTLKPTLRNEWFCFTCQGWSSHDPCEGCREEYKPL